MGTLVLDLGSDNVWLAFGETARISQLKIKENTVPFGDENDRSCTDTLRFSFLLWHKPCGDFAWPAYLSCLCLCILALSWLSGPSVQSVFVKLGGIQSLLWTHFVIKNVCIFKWLIHSLPNSKQASGRFLLKLPIGSIIILKYTELNYWWNFEKRENEAR